ncbi:MAG: penicillin acylase family protein [Acidobacteriota bacterium]
MKRIILYRSLLSLILCLNLVLPLVGAVMAQPRQVRSRVPQALRPQSIEPTMMAGLKAKVEVIRDKFGIPHIFAKRLEDAVFMQGFLHAQDRFFQMDVTRRTAEGTLAEVLGPGPNNSVLLGDVQLRALGLSRSAAAAFPLLRAETRRLLKAYTRGVNSYLANNPLPAEYQELKITQKRMWTELDCLSVAKAIAFSLSFDLNDITYTLALQAYQAAGQAQGFDGAALFYEDMYRTAPFDPTFTVPDALGRSVNETAANTREDQATKQLREQQRTWSQHLARTIKPATLRLAEQYVARLREIPYLANSVRTHDARNGSNWFILSGQLTESGFPMLTGDQHFDFSTPPIWYQIQLNTKGGGGERPVNVIGVSVPGAPGVALGHNDNVAWAATITVFDVTDVYQEEIAPEFGGLSTIYKGKREPVTLRTETFRANQVTADKTDNIVVVPPSDSVPARFATVPRRNNGPILALDLSARTALSLQNPGLGPTLEVEAFLDMNRSRSIKEFQRALQFFDVGSVNMAVISTKGDIAYFTTGELPLREDLEAGKVNGVPPFLIRDGRGGNEWQSLRRREPRQALPNDILPAEEMPQVINPPRGFVVSANNDPAGTTANNNPLEKRRPNGGIYYLSGGYDFGSRAARLTREIQQAVQSGKKISVEMARRFQASGKMRDAEILMPFIQQAFANAQKPDAPAALAALAADAGVSEALARFAQWDFTTPTGLRIGYDAFVPFNQSEPTEAQISASVATTIYSMWRSFIVRNTLDAALAPHQIAAVSGYEGEIALSALRNLLDKFAMRKGVGASGIAFFSVPSLSDASAEAQRDFLILQSLRQALDTLAGPDFELAFHGSTNQRDYRWGMLHRGFFPHQFGDDSRFTIPSMDGNFRSPLPGLYGIPRDGGYEVPNACSHNVRARGVNDFMFVHGPSQRFTVVMKPGAIDAVNALPGGQSGDLNSPFHDNLLNFWLVCDVYPFISDKQRLGEQTVEQLIFLPAK